MGESNLAERTLSGGRCSSTHGAAGYNTLGDYWSGDTIVCCLCGTVIDNPSPTGALSVGGYKPWESLSKWWHGEAKYWVPTYPAWLLGRRPFWAFPGGVGCMVGVQKAKAADLYLRIHIPDLAKWCQRQVT